MTDDGTPNEPGPGEPGFGDPWHPDGGVPPGYQQPGHDHPQQGYPRQGYPQQGYAQQGHPQQGDPHGGQGQPGYGTPAYGQPGYAAYGVPTHVPGASQNANVALGLSVGGLATYLVGFCCAPLALIGLVLCGVGLFMGYREVKAIDAGLSSEAGRNTAKAALIIGGVGVGLFAIGLVLFGFLFGASLLA